MSAFKNHKFSLVRYVRALAPVIAARLGIDLPAFVDLDAHAQLSELPNTDVIGVLGFAVHYQGKLIVAHINAYASTVDDPGLVRLVEMMDIISDAFKPGAVVPVYEVNNTTSVTPVSWLKVTDDGSIDPVGRENTRSIQVMSLRMLSGQTAS